MSLNECLKCMNHAIKYSTSAIIHVEKKPSIEYNDQQWCPAKIKILFINESPPFHQYKGNRINDSYFYNPLESNKFFGFPSPLLGTLSWNIFSLLGFNKDLSKNEKLMKFKELSCFYIDTIKCRAERFNKKNLINETIKNCSSFLESELIKLKPEIIVVLGERALFGINNCTQFEGAFPSTSINKLMEQTLIKPIIINKTTFYFSPIPIWRNRLYVADITLLFQHLKNKLDKLS
ncbi:MAG: hypothetical protein JXA54_09185 [Candidatus Heimdallarchaeota archaeon]|nr:hypothetical protein [Candidatus Heimdallarchaeota archaeon]